MSKLDKQALREAAERAKNSFIPNFRVPARDVLALLDELETKEEQRANWFRMAQKLGGDLDTAERLIAELDQRLIEYAGIATREARRVAELEARTVNLPAACADDEYFIDGVFQALRYERDVERAIIAAGIKVKGA
ncbi:ead/Ea22-like family protein [Salmonella enterica]|nr:ead/Ea22-like family protein [Salmonella enterica]EEJ9026332.1 ead/Ea22-like family protein [Salmonella enterica subsp. enterica]